MCLEQLQHSGYNDTKEDDERIIQWIPLNLRATTVVGLQRAIAKKDIPRGYRQKECTELHNEYIQNHDPEIAEFDL